MESLAETFNPIQTDAQKIEEIKNLKVGNRVSDNVLEKLLLKKSMKFLDKLLPALGKVEIDLNYLVANGFKDKNICDVPFLAPMDPASWSQQLDQVLKESTVFLFIIDCYKKGLISLGYISSEQFAVCITNGRMMIVNFMVFNCRNFGGPHVILREFIDQGNAWMAEEYLKSNLFNRNEVVYTALLRVALEKNMMSTIDALMLQYALAENETPSQYEHIVSAVCGKANVDQYLHFVKQYPTIMESMAPAKQVKTAVREQNIVLVEFLKEKYESS